MLPDPLDDDDLAATLTEAWSGIGAADGLRKAVMCRLLGAWSDPERGYHGVRHLRECMALWMLWRGEARCPWTVALALWFHDAIYDPRAGDNEQRSAAWAARELVGAGVSASRAQEVYDLVMMTSHDGAPAAAEGNRDADLLLDIDLAILGSDEGRFAAYEAGVREEYAWVPGPVYRARRAAVLAGFLARERIYRTEAARQRFETQARRNLQASIARLRFG